MKNLKKLFISTLPILITYILTLLILILSALIYHSLGYNNVDQFLSISPYILIPIYLIITIILIDKYNIKIKIFSTKKEKYFFYTSLGISISIFFNMIIFKFFKINQTVDSIKPIMNIISSGIIGPIYEEVLFRGVFYQQLLKFNSQKNSLLITTICFSLIHLSPIKIIYALGLGYVFTKIYQQDNNILSPIIIHVSANITSIFLFEYNTYLLLFSLINLILCINIVNKKISFED